MLRRLLRCSFIVLTLAALVGLHGRSAAQSAQHGLPIVKDGKVIGRIGSGGSSAANDEKFAQAGLDAVK